MELQDFSTKSNFLIRTPLGRSQREGQLEPRGDFHVKGPWQILAKEMGIIKKESIRKLSNITGAT